ncbi:hypothetical protein [Nocardia niigatensis]|uniref:hypothetical protein n=1 Tax=Nocardia niigatensis TaxID=209249 RepID=UPI000594273F|nr:hypothetical protein [Nocardia niigatensis]
MSAQRKTTTQRQLGWRHQQVRTQLLARHSDGTPCWWCAKPMYRTQTLDADHSQPRSRGGAVADRLLHSWCNRERGDGSRDDQRPALTGKALEQDEGDRAAWCLLPW